MFSFFKKQKNQSGKYQRPYYSIRSKKANRVLDIAQDGEHKGHGIIWDGYGGDNQQFTIKQKGPDFYIVCKQSKQYLTVQGPANGAKLYLAPKNHSQDQKFRIEEQGHGSKEYVIYTSYGKCLDVENEGKKNGNVVIQWDFHGGDNQIWNLLNPSNITSSSSQFEN